MARPTRPLVWHQLRFALPLAQDAAVGLVERILADGSLGRVVLELRASGGQAIWAVGSSAGERLVSVVRELVPGCRVSRGFSRRVVDQAVVVSARPAGAGLATERLSAVVRAVLAALAVTAEGEELVVQLQLGRRFSPQVLGRVEPQGWLELLGLVPIPSLSGERGRRMRAQVGRHRAAVCLRLGVRAASPLRQRTLLQGLLGALRLLEGPGVRLRARMEHPAKLDGVRRPWRAGLELGAGEIVAMVGWPVGEGALPATPSAHPRVLALPQARETQRAFATGVADQAGERLGISIGDALYHTVLLGPTGAGKSTALAHLALADIRAGRGVLLIDPKTDLVADILARIPASRTRDVVVIDPTSSRPVGINPLARAQAARSGALSSVGGGVPGGGASPELVADTVLATLKGVFAESWGVRVEQVLSAALVTLARTPGATLVDLPLVLTNAAYRQRLIAASGADPLGTGQFWAAYEALSEAQRQQWVGPVLTRLQPFLIRPHLRATLGQAAPSFDLGEVFTRRRIVLVSLNKGVLGAESARLLGSLLVGQLWPLILARAAVEPSRRHVVSVFIDEVQDYLSLPGSLADALAQARSLGAAFHLAHQYRGQLPPALKAGIDANARNKIIFSLSAADAAELAHQAIDLEAADFQLLPRFGVYTRTMHHGRENPWCHATTLPPTPPVQDALALRASSQARYGQDAAQIEAALLARLGQNDNTPGDTSGDVVARPTLTGATDAPGGRGGEATNEGTGPANGVPGSTAGVVFGRRPGRDGGTA
ncbi:AAA-like domain protein [Actinomyces naeslundii]|uniref:type IV secretory system conjugative DNA transfer family protein n=1 Tax=Actinomyces naeslundii TaxID=1655 RepID=UPI001958EB66|nr:hypothetical protein [Actinomyces naeslundii]VTX88827.1 AAA-like domain protein [Actinomyces naeslundii]